MIESYLRELDARLADARVGARLRRRLVAEARDHLTEAALERGEEEAVRGFGPAAALVRTVAAELATARTRRAAYAAFAALAPAGLAYAGLFLAFPASSAVRASGGSVPGLGALAFAGIVLLPQISFVCGVLALVRVLRRAGVAALPGSELRVVRRRAGAALASGAGTIGCLAAFGLDQRSAVPGWWLAGTLGAAGVLLPVLGAAGAATARAGAPAAFAGAAPDTAVEDVASVLARVPLLAGVRLPADPTRFALRVAGLAAAAVAAAGVAAGDPFDGIARAALEGVAVLACYALLGRPLALRR